MSERTISLHDATRMWIVVPGIILVEFAKDIASALLTVDGLKKGKGKKQQ